VANNLRCERDPEVQAILEAGSESLEWVAHEFAGVNLGDKRLNRRLVKTAEHLAKSPSSPINEACGSWASTQAAYRLFDNAKALPAAILKPHIAETAKRIVAQGGPVLVVPSSGRQAGPSMGLAFKIRSSTPMDTLPRQRGWDRSARAIACMSVA
jgi:hypothetical protein